MPRANFKHTHSQTREKINNTCQASSGQLQQQQWPAESVFLLLLVLGLVQSLFLGLAAIFGSEFCGGSFDILLSVQVSLIMYIHRILFSYYSQFTHVLACNILIFEFEPNFISHVFQWNSLSGTKSKV
jgi:hypothetical protein